MKILNHHEETIIAQCTPQGKGALALLRISGVDAWTVADSFAKLANKKKLAECQTHTIQFGAVVGADGQSIDQVLFLLMRGPSTFTGENTVEITCHNNPFIIDAIIKTAIAAGARLAEQGEFSRRAVAHNKIDLLQAEAINELIHAQTSVALKQSLCQVQGSLSSWVIAFEQSLLKAYAFCEASFEFIDDEIEFGGDIKKIIQTMLDAIAYKVYADATLTMLLATITAEPLCYTQHQICAGKTSTYYVTAVDANGFQSEPAIVTI